MSSTPPVTDTPHAGAVDDATITTTEEGLSVSVPPTRNWLWGIYYGFFLVGWAVGEISAVTMLLLQPMMTADSAFVMAWLVFWSIAGYVLGSRWLFMFFGREQLLVGPAGVTLRTTVLGQSRSRSFDITRVRKIRTTGQQLKFDVGGETYKFGQTLSESTCQTIREAMERSLASTGGTSGRVAPASAT
jgi:hypothetical protein